MLGLPFLGPSCARASFSRACVRAFLICRSHTITIAAIPFIIYNEKLTFFFILTDHFLTDHFEFTFRFALAFLRFGFAFRFCV